MSRTDVRTNGGAEAQTTMTIRSSDTAPESTRIEPIFDASGTLRRNALRRQGAEQVDPAGSEPTDRNPRTTR